MARGGDALRKCPTCLTPVADATALGLRDFRWVNEALPGKVGGMDLDFCINQAATERALFLELKPQGARVSTGARLTFALLVKKGFDVWVVWELGEGSVRVAHLNERGEEAYAATMSVASLAAAIIEWWEAGLT